MCSPASKIIMTKQMQPHLNQIFSIYLSAYRALFGCHSVLIHSTKTWKKAIDNKQYVGIIMSDLSKAFDCLPHGLLLKKLKHYRFGDPGELPYQQISTCKARSSSKFMDPIKQRCLPRCGRRTSMF